MLHSKPSISVCVALCRKSNLQISRALALIQFIEGSGLIKTLLNYKVYPGLPKRAVT